MRYVLAIVLVLCMATPCWGDTIPKGQLGKEDVVGWNGKDQTFTSRTPGSRPITKDKFDWVGVDVKQLYGSRTIAALNSAKRAAGSNECTFYLSPGEWTVTDDLTLDENISVRAPPGTTINVSSGKTLTLSGEFIAGNYGKIFVGSGSVALSNREAYAKWWALGDATAAQHTAINTGLTSLGSGSTMYLWPDSGSYFATSGSILFMQGVSIVGPGERRLAAASAVYDVLYTGTGSAFKSYTGNTDSKAHYSSEIRDLTIRATANGAKAIDFTATNYSRVTNVTVLLSCTSGQAQYGFYIDYDDLSIGSYQNHVENFTVVGDARSNGGCYGIYLSGDSASDGKADDNYFEHIMLNRVGQGLLAQYTNNLYVSHIWIEETDDWTIYLGAECDYSIISGVHSEDVTDTHHFYTDALAGQNRIDVTAMSDATTAGSFSMAGANNVINYRQKARYDDTADNIWPTAEVDGDTYVRVMHKVDGRTTYSDGTNWDPTTSGADRIGISWEEGTTWNYMMLENHHNEDKRILGGLYEEVTTTDDTPTDICAIDLPVDGAYVLEGMVSGSNDDQTVHAAYVIHANITRVAGGTVTVQNSTATYSDESDAGLAGAIVGDAGAGAEIRVTGLAATTINWSGSLRVVGTVD